jgi:hypothetical protein
MSKKTSAAVKHTHFLNARDVGLVIICKITIGFPSFWASKLTL